MRDPRDPTGVNAVGVDAAMRLETGRSVTSRGPTSSATAILEQCEGEEPGFVRDCGYDKDRFDAFEGRRCIVFPRAFDAGAT